MASGKNGQPVVVVTGRGIITSLGAGKADNWAKLTAGESGIHRITRFANEGLKTTIAGSVYSQPRLWERSDTCKPAATPAASSARVAGRRRRVAPSSSEPRAPTVPSAAVALW